MKDDESDGHGGAEKSRVDPTKSFIDQSEHTDSKGGDLKDKKQGDSNKVKFRHAFQLRTQQEGYNSGRQYIIQARTEEERQKIVADLTKLSKIANDKFLAKSQFRKTQARAPPSPADPRPHSHLKAGGARPACCSSLRAHAPEIPIAQTPTPHPQS
jgi:hypothetical protein